MVEDNRETERTRYVTLALAAIERRGEEINRAILASETRTPRAKIDTLFPSETDLFDAIVEQWYAPHIAIMEEVVAADMPTNRKLYEFFARRFLLTRERFRKDPAAFQLYCELGQDNFENIQSYIDLADHYLSELIAQAQADGFFQGLSINQTLSLINQMVHCYTNPDVILYLDDRLSEEKLALIIDTLFAGLSGEERGANGLARLRRA